jgi:hypothetical protein
MTETTLETILRIASNGLIYGLITFAVLIFALILVG